MRRKKSRGGFTLLELLALIAVIALVSAIGLARSLEPRKRFNEACAVDLLEMIQSARVAWVRSGRSTGFPPSLWELGKMQSEFSAPSFPRSLMPDGFSLYGGISLRSGFLFQEVAGGRETSLGCWATPKLQKYSGDRRFWLDYSKGKVFEWKGGNPSFKDSPPESGLVLLQPK